MLENGNSSQNSNPQQSSSQQTLTQSQKQELAQKVYDLLLKEINIESERLGR